MNIDSRHVSALLIGAAAGLSFVSPWLAVTAAVPMCAWMVAGRRFRPITVDAGLSAPIDREARATDPASMHATSWPADLSPLVGGPVEPPATLVALREELEVRLPALPLLGAQLEEAVRSADQAVGQLCSAFQDIARRAQGSVGGGHGQGSVEGRMQSARATLNEVVTAMGSGSLRSNEALEQMKRLEQGMHATMTIAREVSQFTGQVRLMSLNARIEATRMGNQGRAFAVIADEITELARQGAEMVSSITSTVEGLRRDSEATYQTLTALAGEAKGNQRKVGEALDVLAAGFEALRETVSQMECQKDALARDIAQAVMSLQFQDALSQRVLHVVEELSEIREALSGPLVEAGGTMDGPASGKAWLERMKSQYTMGAERQVLARLTGSHAPEPDFQDNNVELF